MSPASPMDVFSANGSLPQIPATFCLPPPKYGDVFPHEEPGQVAEMLKEPEIYDSDEDYSDEDAEPRRENNSGNTNNNNHINANTTFSSAATNGVITNPRENIYTIA